MKIKGIKAVLTALTLLICLKREGIDAKTPNSGSIRSSSSSSSRG